MAAPQFKKIQTKDVDLNRIQDNIADVLGYISKHPMYQAIEVRDQVLVTGSTNLLQHGLGRAVKGYVVTAKSVSATIYDGIKAAAVDLTQYLPLVTDNNVTVSLVVW